VDVEVLKRALRELVEREPSFLRDLVLEALRSDGGAAEALLDLFTKHPEAKLKLAQAVAGAVAIPLNVVTKEDLKQLATKQDIKLLEDQMATKEDLKQYATKQDLETAIGDLKKWAEAEFREIRDVMATKEDLKQYATKQDLETAIGDLNQAGPRDGHRRSRRNGHQGGHQRHRERHGHQGGLEAR